MAEPGDPHPVTSSLHALWPTASIHVAHVLARVSAQTPTASQHSTRADTGQPLTLSLFNGAKSLTNLGDVQLVGHVTPFTACRSGPVRCGGGGRGAGVIHEVD